MIFLLLLVYLSGSPTIAFPPPLVYTMRDSTSLPTISSSPSTLAVCTCSNARSIWDIIWSCLATIFAWSWVSVHPHMPAPGEQWWKGFLGRLECMFWAILMPELVIYWAMRQWFGARKAAKKYHDRGWTKTHGHYLQMGGFMLYRGTIPQGVLSEKRFQDLLEPGQIKFPSVSKEDIDDRSKSDALAKAVAVIQTGWFVFQCITRRVAGLVTTQIELFTLALAVLNVFMYFFWWDKPMDVSTSVPVYLLDTTSEAEKEHKMVEERSDASPPITNPRPSVFKALTNVFWRWPKAAITAILRRMGEMVVWGDDGSDDSDSRWGIHDGDLQVPTFYAIPMSSHEDELVSIFTSLVALIFGAIHCVGWNFTFPTRAELVIWRVCSIAIVAIPGILVFQLFVLLVVVGRTSAYSIPHILGNLLVRGLIKLNVGLSPWYVVARMVLVVEALITLRDLPQGAYDTVDWTSFLPHV